MQQQKERLVRRAEQKFGDAVCTLFMAWIWFSRRVIKPYTGIETFAYKWWWKMYRRHMSRLCRANFMEHFGEAF